MFIKLELWDEEPRRDNGEPVRFGSSLNACLDMKLLKVRHHPVNLHCIQSFENMHINTIGRPGTSENKEDILMGVRLLLANGKQYVLINDKDPTFESALAHARDTADLIYNHGQSKYMKMFASQE